MNLSFKTFHPLAKLPARATETAAGYDCYAVGYEVIISNGFRKVPLGWGVELPQGLALAVLGRSGLAAKGIQVHHGLIDPDFRGEVHVVLFNHSDTIFTISPGDRICQVVLHNYAAPNSVWAEELSSTMRGEGGFGSTGA